MATVFEKIIARELPAEIVYETGAVIAFLDVSPNNPGHTLVIPKTPCTNLFDIAPESWAAVSEAVRMLAPIIMRAVNATGMNVMMNNGEAAGQLVPYAHIHLIPRFPGDGYQHWQGHPYAPNEMARVGAAIRAAFAS